MQVLHRSELGRRSFLTSTAIPDLTNKIIRSDDQYCEAGGFGDVFRCRCKAIDGVKEVAVKAFRFSFTIDEHKRDKRDEGKVSRIIRRELGIWKRLGHRNVVPFLGIAYGFGRRGSASLVSMWMPHGTLHTFLEAHENQLAVAHRLQLLLDIANGLQYLHSFPLVHGDLSSNNVLLDHNYNACLTDFGCASLVGEIPEGFTYLNMSTVRPGTLRWAAPEHFSLHEGETKHTVKSDIYSFGNLALLVLSGKCPWSEIRVDAAVVLRLSQSLKPDRPLARPIDNRHWALIEQCWSSIPERPFAKDIVYSLKQQLDTHPPPPPLRDLIDVPTLSSSVPNCFSNEELEPTEPFGLRLPETPRSCTGTGTSASPSNPTPEDITRHSDPSTFSPHHVPRPSSQDLTIDTQSLASQKQQQCPANEFGEVNQVHRSLPENAPDLYKVESSLEHHLDTPLSDATSKNTVVVHGLPTYLNEAQVHQFFQGFGKINTHTLVREGGSGPSKGIVFLEYDNASVTDVVVQTLNGMELGDHCLVVQRQRLSSADVDQNRGSPHERKAKDSLRGKKVTQVGNEDPKKRPGHAHAGYLYGERRVLDAYQILLSVLDSSSSMRSSLDSRHEVVQARVADLANNAFSCGVRFDDLQMAIELLEQGRGILWNQLARFDISLTALEYGDDKGQDFVKKFKQLSATLTKHAQGIGEDGIDPYWRVHEKWESVVEEIRRQDGLSRFLLPPRFDDLREAAECGPVIIVNGSKYTCDVVIVLHTRPPIHVPLECSLDDVVQLCFQFSELIQDPRVYGEHREFWIRRSLRGLWATVVERTVTVLRNEIGLPLGSRIWWCPTSKFTILPFHAAGPYKPDKKNLMDIYISSYAPSLSALVRSRDRARVQRKARNAPGTADAISFAAISQAQPSAELKLCEIPEVEREIQRIRNETNMPPSVIFETIAGDAATVEGAVQGFKDHRWVHLACHGSQHPTKPFESWFAMRDGPLTLLRIIQERYTHSELAFLSACHTAVGDKSTPDEVLHLAAGMQFAGFNGVIGTLWMVDDSTAHEVVTRFYREMFKYPDIDCERAAAALNIAVVESAKEVPLEKRIVFVHIGI